jgi:hypothetical protein
LDLGTAAFPALDPSEDLVLLIPTEVFQEGAIVDAGGMNRLSSISNGGKFGKALTEELGEVQDAVQNESSQ